MYIYLYTYIVIYIYIYIYIHIYKFIGAYHLDSTERGEEEEGATTEERYERERHV
jgi:hypothetical protein